MSKYQVGQELLATRPYARGGDPEPVVVTAVGRKYVRTVNPKWSYCVTRKFDIETGAEFITGGYTGGHLYTQQEWDERQRRGELRKRLLGLGVEAKLGGRHAYSKATVAQLEAIIAILAPEQGN